MSITYQKVFGIVAGIILTTLCVHLSGSDLAKPKQPNVNMINMQIRQLLITGLA